MKIEPDKKICECCGKEFSCGANAGNCWCFSEKVDRESLEKIAKEFLNCLCPDCLTDKSEQSPEIEI